MDYESNISGIHDESQSTVQKQDNLTVIEADVSGLVGQIALNEQEAYDIYNDYAFRLGFSIRRSVQRQRANKVDLSMKQYCCSNEGSKKTNGKCYTKHDTRTCCKAKITCFVDEKGAFTIAKHDMEHNHKLCPEDKHHLLHSQRVVKQAEIDFLMQLIGSGVKFPDALRVLKKEKGGSPRLGFNARDAYNEVAKKTRKCLDRPNVNSLIQTFLKRKEECNGYNPTQM